MISQEEPMVQFVEYLKPNDQYWTKFSKLIVETNIKKKEDVQIFTQENESEMERKYRMKKQSAATLDVFKTIQQISKIYFHVDQDDKLNSRQIQLFMKSKSELDQYNQQQNEENQEKSVKQYQADTLEQMLKIKFQKELLELVQRKKEGQKEEQIAEGFLNDIRPPKDRNTIIQHQFLIYCYEEDQDFKQLKNKDEFQMEEVFQAWKQNRKGEIIRSTIEFISNIFECLN